MSSLIWIQTVWHSDRIPEIIFGNSFEKSADDRKQCKLPSSQRAKEQSDQGLLCKSFTYLIITLCMLSIFFMLYLSSADFFQNKLFQNILSGTLAIRVSNIFGSRWGLTFCWSCSGSKLSAKVISRLQKNVEDKNRNSLHGGYLHAFWPLPFFFILDSRYIVWSRSI